eukprot:4280272-Pleurochrysis_carterae.AAC.1
MAALGEQRIRSARQRRTRAKPLVQTLQCGARISLPFTYVPRSQRISHNDAEGNSYGPLEFL